MQTVNWTKHTVLHIANTEKPYGELVLKALLIELFYILDSQEKKVKEGEALTEAMADIKRYIDANYASITSISDIANHFFIVGNICLESLCNPLIFLLHIIFPDEESQKAYHF